LRNAFHRIADKPALPNTLKTLRRQRTGGAKQDGKEKKADH
jgi:hypothetical protein